MAPELRRLARQISATWAAAVPRAAPLRALAAGRRRGRRLQYHEPGMSIQLIPGVYAMKY